MRGWGRGWGWGALCSARGGWAAHGVPLSSRLCGACDGTMAATPSELAPRAEEPTVWERCLPAAALFATVWETGSGFQLPPTFGRWRRREHICVGPVGRHLVVAPAAAQLSGWRRLGGCSCRGGRRGLIAACPWGRRRQRLIIRGRRCVVGGDGCVEVCSQQHSRRK